MRRAAVRSTSEGARAHAVGEWGCGRYAAESCAVRPTRRRRRLHLVSVTEISTWVRDRENLREISRCAHLERKEVTCDRSNPDHTPADHPWLSQGWPQAKTIEKWALVREKIAVRPRPPLRTRVGEATQRGLILAGRREAPHVASTGGAEAAIPLSPRAVKRRVGPVKTSRRMVDNFRVQPPLPGLEGN